MAQRELDALVAALSRRGGDPLRLVGEALRAAGAEAVVATLTPRASEAAASVALGGALLALGRAADARERIIKAIGKLGADEAATTTRATYLLAKADAALGNKPAAKGALGRSLGALLALDDPALPSELAALLRSIGETLAADALEARGRSAPAAQGSRLDVVARLAKALNSSLVATASPLHTVLEAVMAETAAKRGFLMLYDDAETLRFELGLSSSGRKLSSEDFQYSSTIVGAALERAGAVLVPDMMSWAPFAAAMSAQELGLRSALCAPLRVDRRRHGDTLGSVRLPAVNGIAGVIYVDSTKPASFAADDGAFFELLADCAAVALRAARTAERLRALETAAAEERAQETRGRARRGASEGTLGEVAVKHSYDGVVTRDHGLRTLLAHLDRVIDESDVNVLVRGESGTGKELLARAIHRHGARAKGPFVAVDCGALSDELVASELFGHEPGAFTGATSTRAGLLEQAHGGVLFLDEVGEASPALQGALLRALEAREVRRLGGDRATPFDARIVSATNRDLRALVERGQFRHDLLFRLAVVDVKIPPLRERRGDVPFLVRHFLARIEGEGLGRRAIEPAALARLEDHPWPGNVRELENVLRALVLATREGPIARAAVDAVLGDELILPPEPSAAAKGAGDPLAGSLDEIERRAIAKRLDALAWNQLRAAETLGIDRRTLSRKLRRYGIKRDR